MYKRQGVEPGDVRSLEDLARLPFTVKNDLRDNYPYGLFTDGLNEVVRIHSSSGTTGPVSYTHLDVYKRQQAGCSRDL